MSLLPLIMMASFSKNDLCGVATINLDELDLNSQRYKLDLPLTYPETNEHAGRS